MSKWVYGFSSKGADGDRSMKDLLGGKGANLAEMCSLKLPVPPGFTVSTGACLDYYEQNKAISDEIKSEVKAALAEVESITGKKFGYRTIISFILSLKKLTMFGLRLQREA